MIQSDLREIRKIARADVEDLFNKTINSIVEKTFEFDDNQADEYLISTHFAFRETFNKKKGTGRGTEAFSELWYFLYVKKFLEKFLRFELMPIKTHRLEGIHHHYEAYYKGNKLILSSDISIESNFGLKIHNKKIKPDIFIGIRRNDMEIIPVAIFEIKLYQNSPQDIEKVANRFLEIKNTLTLSNIDLPFFIFLYLQHSQYVKKIEGKNELFNVQLERFKSLSRKSMLIINRILKWDEEKGYNNKIEGSIHHIMDKVVSFIKKLDSIKLEK